MYNYKTLLSKQLSRKDKMLLDKTLLSHANMLSKAQTEFSASDLFEPIDLNNLALRDMDLKGIEDEDLIFLIEERLEAMRKRKLLKIVPDQNELIYTTLS